MRIFSAILCIFFLSFLSVQASANTWRFNPKEGDVLVYTVTMFDTEEGVGEPTKSWDFALTYKGLNESGLHFFESTDKGKHQAFNSFGARVVKGILSVQTLDGAISHNGIASSDMSVGSSWKAYRYNVYREDNYHSTWQTSCTVKAHGSETVLAGTFSSVYEECQTYREPRPNPRNEKRWFDRKTGYIIKDVRSWGGDKPGKVIEELKELRRKEKVSQN